MPLYNLVGPMSVKNVCFTTKGTLYSTISHTNLLLLTDGSCDESGEKLHSSRMKLKLILRQLSMKLEDLER